MEKPKLRFGITVKHVMYHIMHVMVSMDYRESTQGDVQNYTWGTGEVFLKKVMSTFTLKDE